MILNAMGLTVLLTAQATIDPNVTHHIKLAIADAGDSALDSWVFLQESGFSGQMNVNLVPDITLCDGETAILDAGAWGGTYLWSTGETTQTITVSTAGNYSVTVTTPFGTGSDDINVFVIPPIVVDLVPDISLACNGGSVVLDAGNPGATYLWSTGETSQTITVSVIGIYSVIVTAQGCSGSDEIEVTIGGGILPGPAGEITGQAVVCNYSQAIYCVPYITDATSYIWEYSGTGVIFVEMAKCQSCIILQFTGEATSGILTVRGHNDCGDGLVSPDYPIVVELYPADAGPITGPIKVNQGQTGVPYSVPVIAYATSYIWSYNGTGVTINGSGNSVTLDFDANATSGWLTVAGNNNCGNGLYTFLPITVDPNTPIYGPAIVAPGQSNVPYFVNKTPNVSNYLWSYTGSGATINSKSNIISIDFSKNASSGDFIVTGMINGGEAFESMLPVKVESGFSNNNGKSSGTISENETIEVFPNPANEVINVSSASGLKRIVVTNSTGQIVYNEEISGNNSQVNVSDFIPGIYFIKIETQYNTVVKKVSVR